MAASGLSGNNRRMSDYLYNILARSLGLIETAQPLVTSLFEPPRDFKPVDAPQTSLPTEESAHAQAMQQSALNSSFSTDVPAALSQTESKPPAALTIERRPRLSSPEHGHEKTGLPPTSLSQPSLQSGEQPVVQPKQTPPAAIQPDAPIAGTAEQAWPNAQTIRTPGQAQLESSDSALKNPAHSSSVKQESPAEAKALSGRRTHDSAPLAAQRPHRLEPFAEPKAIEQPLSREKPPTPSVEINNVAHQRSETVIVQPQISRYVETPQPDSPQSSRATEAEQIVQVTIGRIEVRAAPQPTTRQGAQTRSAPQPSQSLEEYLRQRAQGGANR